MIARHLIVLCLFAVAGCGDSALNPFNWGRTEEVLIRSPDGGAGSPEQLYSDDPRPMIDQVLGAQTDPMPSGIILTARGLPPEQGFWAAELVRVPAVRSPEGALVYEFKAIPDPNPQPVGTPVSREIVVARTISKGALEGIRSIIILAERNQVTLQR